MGFKDRMWSRLLSRVNVFSSLSRLTMWSKTSSVLNPVSTMISSRWSTQAFSCPARYENQFNRSKATLHSLFLFSSFLLFCCVRPIVNATCESSFSFQFLLELLCEELWSSRSKSTHLALGLYSLQNCWVGVAKLAGSTRKAEVREREGCAHKAKA